MAVSFGLEPALTSTWSPSPHQFEPPHERLVAGQPGAGGRRRGRGAAPDARRGQQTGDAGRDGIDNELREEHGRRRREPGRPTNDKQEQMMTTGIICAGRSSVAPAGDGGTNRVQGPC